MGGEGNRDNMRTMYVYVCMGIWHMYVYVYVCMVCGMYVCVYMYILV
jgi:hypothetical protein